MKFLLIISGNLLFHQRSHNKGSNAERPFRCDLCPKDFMCKGHLVSHRRSHSGERPHACPDCGKTFVEKGNMLRHLRKHTSENAAQAAQPNGTVPQQQPQQPSTSNIQIPQISQAQAMPPPASTGMLGQAQHIPLHQQPSHPVVVPTANGNVLASY